MFSNSIRMNVQQQQPVLVIVVPDPPDVDPFDQPQVGSAEGECRVCSADGASRHYGSICCSGCKGFFRRSVRFQKLYRCPFEQQCAINKLYRNCCRACRFQKCLSIGLDPNLVHGDWGQSSTVSHAGTLTIVPPAQAVVSQRRLMGAANLSSVESLPDSLPIPNSEFGPDPTASEPNSNCTAQPNSSSSASSTEQSSLELVKHARLHNSDKSALALGFGKGAQFAPAGNDCVALSNYFVAVERLCDLFVDCPLPPASESIDIPALYSLDVPVEIALKQPGKVSPRTPIGWTGQYLINKESMARTYCRAMVHYFDWASHVPELNTMTEEDRQTLVVKRAMRCIWLLSTFRSAKLNIEGVAGCCERMFPYSPAERERLEPELKDLFMDSATMAFTELVLPFRQLELSESEYALLRALCLFSPVSRLSDEGRVQVVRAQNKYLNALGDLVRQRNARCLAAAELDALGPMGRMSRLMMFLATIEQVAQMDDNAFAMLNVFNMAGMRGLLTYDIHIRALDEQQR